MSNSTTLALVSYLPTKPFLLVYTVPLLVISVLVTFCGTFFILDRSYTFSPRNKRSDKYVYPVFEEYGYWERYKRGRGEWGKAAFEKERDRECFWWWRLEGGIGGLAVGYVYGVNLATLLSLLIPSLTPLNPLTPPTFLATVLVSGIFCSLLAGRFKLVTILLCALSSGFLTSLVVCIIVHPPLLGRWIVVGIISGCISIPTILFGILHTFVNPYVLSASSADGEGSNCCVGCIPNTIHPLLRFCTASMGSFTLLLCISLLPNPPLPSWPGIYTRLYISDGPNWGTPQEKGLIAAWVFFTALGIVEDWALKRWLGENPDEKWDEYLERYAKDMPYGIRSLDDRAGDFRPLPGFWDSVVLRFGSKKKGEEKIAFPGVFDDSEEDVKMKPLLADEADGEASTPFPEPFYDQVPPPASQLALLRSKSKLDPLQVSDDPDDAIGNEEGTTSEKEDEEEFTLPAFVTKRRKKDRLGKLRANLKLVDTKKKEKPKSVGFRPVNSSTPSSAGLKGDDYFDDGSMSSATLVGSRGGDSASSTGHARKLKSVKAVRKASKDSEDVKETKETKEILAFDILDVPPPIKDSNAKSDGALEYSDYEVDLTNMATSLEQRQREKKEGKPKFMDRHKRKSVAAQVVETTEASMSPLTKVEKEKVPPTRQNTANTIVSPAPRAPQTPATPPPKNATTQPLPTPVSNPPKAVPINIPDRAESPSDRARERVRAFVAAPPTRRHSTQASIVFPVHSPPPLPIPPLPRVASPAVIQSPVLTRSPAQIHSPKQKESRTQSPMTPPMTPPVSVTGHLIPASVPATPSLLNAINRVTLAQQQAYGVLSSPVTRSRSGDEAEEEGMDIADGLPRVSNREGMGGGRAGRKRHGGRDGAWDDFWKDVKTKARSPER